jgi:hypothetical protein
MAALARASSNCKRHTNPHRQRGCYIRTMTANVNLGNKEITGRESQGACREELIGGKLPVVK